ncbi:hypothetical protein SEA_PUREGLOBE5_98 [Arthrobacter phage Pureglobe5]|nr:hypothetical protein SEA_PUREGLOBE5_98 [Arthrobacter phage Pureglobe5]
MRVRHGFFPCRSRACQPSNNCRSTGSNYQQRNTMTSAIRSTIVNALAAKLGEDADYIELQYGQHVTVAEQALAEREWAIADELKAIATRETGYSEENIDEMFEHVGLNVRPKPEPVIEDEPAVDTADLTDGERIAKLEQGQAQIVEALGTLTALAEKHLGTSSL